MEEDRIHLTTIPECEKIEEAGQEREEDQVISPECEQAGEEASQKKETKEVVGSEKREPARLRRSRRLVKKERKDGNTCLVCDGCARGHAQSLRG